MTFAGSGILITGASSGIGREVATRLVGEGARVFITGLPRRARASSSLPYRQDL